VISIAQPQLGPEEAEAAAAVVLSGWLSQGPEVAAFEREFAAAVGASHACAVSNCTTALHLALLAVGTRPGDEILVPSLSFIATANAIRYCGAQPVFVDIERHGFNIDPALLGPAITRRTRAIMCVHQMGMPCDLPAILAVARAHGLPVIEDAACAIASRISIGGVWQSIGQPHGDIACFSLHPRKVITTGEGGMLTTLSAEWDERFRLLRQHGMSVSDLVRHGSRQVQNESYPLLGYNYRLTDLQAAIGRRQLTRLPEIIEGRRARAQRYSELLADIPGITLPSEPEWARSNWQSYCVLLPPQCSQLAVMQSMLDAGVATRRGIMCAHREPPYAGSSECGELVRSEAAQDRGLLLPLHGAMDDTDLAAVAAALRIAVVGQSQTITRKSA
jgi:dTDP-4-amino-4,6-dideoxygalactose transaminase